MVKSHEKFGFAEAETAHFGAQRCKALSAMCLCLHTPNALKTREKPTTDFVFDFLRNMEGQKTTNIVLAKSMPMRSAPTDFTDLHRLSGCVVSPTEFTEFTEVWCKKIPQISQSTQKSQPKTSV